MRKLFLNLAIYVAIGSLGILFVPQPSQAAEDQPRFRLTLGEKVELCEAQLRILSKHAMDKTLPVCEVGTVLPPGVTKPEWEEIDINANATILHRIEWELRYEIADSIEDFNAWRSRLHQRLANPHTRPHLYRIVLTIGPNDTVQLYGYFSAALGCRATHVRKWANYPGMHFFEYDEERKFAKRAPLLPGHLLFYYGQPYVFSSGLTDRTHYWEWLVSIATFRPKAPSDKSPYVSSFIEEFVCGIGANDMFAPPPRTGGTIGDKQ